MCIVGSYVPVFGIFVEGNAFQTHNIINMSIQLASIYQEAQDIAAKKGSHPPTRYLQSLDHLQKHLIDSPQDCKGVSFLTDLLTLFSKLISLFLPDSPEPLYYFLQHLLKILRKKDDLPQDLKHNISLQLCSILKEVNLIKTKLYTTAFDFLLYLHRKSEKFPYFQDCLSFFYNIEV